MRKEFVIFILRELFTAESAVCFCSTDFTVRWESQACPWCLRSVPIGWFLADAVGLGYFIRYRRRLL